MYILVYCVPDASDAGCRRGSFSITQSSDAVRRVARYPVLIEEVDDEDGKFFVSSYLGSSP